MLVDVFVNVDDVTKSKTVHFKIGRFILRTLEGLNICMYACMHVYIEGG